VIGLADCIIDLVETGRTLEENGLVVTEEITTSSARFIVNRASYQLKTAFIAPLIERLSEAIDSGEGN
jgi:ATP phosphoribosyltransferase